MGGACSTYRERRGLYRVLVGKPDRNKPLRRPMRRVKDNIKMDLQKMEWGHELAYLAHNRNTWWALVNAVINHRLP
jgi:hypothetical protein